MMIFNPGISAVSLALLIASFFIVGGVFRIVRAVTVRFRNWSWVVFNGAVTAALGILIWASWPLSGLWLIGLFLGIEMIFYGWSMIMLASAGRAEIRKLRDICGVPA
jgi:uncharacterized membrane protein HdeD (DUF308 family)